MPIPNLDSGTGVTKLRGSWGAWLAVVLFALAMGWMESATVVYLRSLVGRIDPYQPVPLPDSHSVLGPTELVREAATLLMLGTVGWLAGRTWRSRFGYFMIAFGVWAISYYLFLRVICGWPRTLFDWDVLFLLPLPWWGPVLAPMLIATLMLFAGTLLSQFDSKDEPLWPGNGTLVLSTCGVLLALYVFMADAIRLAPRGVQELRRFLPVSFNWSAFGLALLLMGSTIVDLGWKLRLRRASAKSLPNAQTALKTNRARCEQL